MLLFLTEEEEDEGLAVARIERFDREVSFTGVAGVMVVGGGSKSMLAFRRDLLIEEKLRVPLRYVHVGRVVHFTSVGRRQGRFLSQ